MTVVVESESAIDLHAEGKIERDAINRIKVTVEPKPSERFPFEVVLADGASLSAYWYTAEDQRPRAFPLDRFKLPWVRSREDTSVAPQERAIPEIAGGDWLHGKTLFYSDRLLCGRCHLVNGEGGRLGPDLSNLIHRDYLSVMRDIDEPSAAINPDHIAYSVTMDNGEIAVGVVLEETEETVTLGQPSGLELILQKNQIKQRDALSISLMPPGLLNALTAKEQSDLMTFLLTTE